MHREKTNVLWNRKIGPGYYRMGLAGDGRYSKAKPGQFIMLRFPGRITPLLRRPFSIHRLIDDTGHIIGIEILYKVVGEGTRELSRMQKDDTVDILGPLGNGFSFSDHHKNIYIVAGGIGVAPLVFLASHLQASGVDPSACTVFIGGKSKYDLLCGDDFLRLGMKIQMTTDDGSAGDQCLVTHPLEIASNRRRPDVIYACGPAEMLKCVVGIAEKYAVPCQVSMETVMACGIGACLGCAVERKATSDSYMHVCIDGPVFDASMVKI